MEFASVTILRSSRVQVIPPLMGVQSFAPRSAAAAAWWEVAGKTCVAAYQPKGAATYAASKVNLAQPGTYDAGDGAAYPTFNAATGWTFVAASSQYLTTGLFAANDQSWSMLVQFANAPSSGTCCVVGSQVAVNTNRFGVFSTTDASYPNIVSYMNGGIGVQVYPRMTSGNLGFARDLCYRNGTNEGGLISTWSGANTVDIWIGCRNNNGAVQFPFSGDILALVVYSATLSAAEMATVSAAMAAL